MVPDLMACLDGWVMAQGGGDQSSKYPTPEERAELAAYRRKMEAKRRAQGVTDG